MGSAHPPEQAQESWMFLKRRLKELGLADAEQGVMRTKADCFRVCMEGPIVVVYPRRDLVSARYPRRISRRSIQQHLIGGRPVEELVLARAPLPG